MITLTLAVPQTIIKDKTRLPAKHVYIMDTNHQIFLQKRFYNREAIPFIKISPSAEDLFRINYDGLRSLNNEKG